MNENFPYIVKITKPKTLLERTILDMQIIKAIWWCKENFIEDSWEVSQFWTDDTIWGHYCRKFSFKYENDAMHFKLVWG